MNKFLLIFFLLFSSSVFAVPAVPAAPTVGINGSTYTISWASVAGATSYILSVNGYQYPQSTTNAVYQNLIVGGFYSFSVASVDASGASLFSTATPFTVPPVTAAVPVASSVPAASSVAASATTPTTTLSGSNVSVVDTQAIQLLQQIASSVMPVTPVTPAFTPAATSSVVPYSITTFNPQNASISTDSTNSFINNLGASISFLIAGLLGLAASFFAITRIYRFIASRAGVY